MMTQYQIFFIYNYASSDYRDLEILSGMMQILQTKLERDQVAPLIHDLVINSSDEVYRRSSSISCVTSRITTAPVTKT